MATTQPGGTSGIFPCHWDWCRTICYSKTELIAHVNDHIDTAVPVKRKYLKLLESAESSQSQSWASSSQPSTAPELGGIPSQTTESQPSKIARSPSPKLPAGSEVPSHQGSGFLGWSTFSHNVPSSSRGRRTTPFSVLNGLERTPTPSPLPSVPSPASLIKPNQFHSSGSPDRPSTAASPSSKEQSLPKVTPGGHNSPAPNVLSQEASDQLEVSSILSLPPNQEHAAALARIRNPELSYQMNLSLSNDGGSQFEDAVEPHEFMTWSPRGFGQLQPLPIKSQTPVQGQTSSQEMPATVAPYMLSQSQANPVPTLSPRRVESQSLPQSSSGEQTRDWSPLQLQTQAPLSMSYDPFTQTQP